MSHSPESLELHQQWVEQIRRGDDAAWRRLVEQFEGRLLAFARSKVQKAAIAEEIVQETFIGFFRSLPNYDAARPLESYLFQICSFKITDLLRRGGRQIDLSGGGRWDDSAAMIEPVAAGPTASSIARGHERDQIEEQAIITALTAQIAKWKERRDYKKLACIELLMLCGAGNKDVSRATGLSEQQVANYKADFLARTRQLLARS